MGQAAVAYSDPNCPFCFATEALVRELGLEDRVSWRGVQHAPELPLPMRPATGTQAAELHHEIATIQRLAPGLGVGPPPGKPNTGAAIAHGVAALAADPVAGRAFVRSLYEAFWTRGADLSDAAVLAALAADAGLPGLHADAAAREQAATWGRRWQALGLGGVPVLVRDDGGVLYGLPRPEALALFLPA